MYKKILSDVSWLKTIMNIDNNNNDDTHLCHHCGFQGESAKHLHNHLRAHDIRSFFCEDCGQSFIGKNQYDNHKSTHKTFAKSVKKKSQ